MYKLFFLLILPVFNAGPTLNVEHTTSFVVFPQDCNHYNTLFGGKIVSEMDRCAGITARRLLYTGSVKEAVTVSIDKLIFHKPAYQRDLIFVTGKVMETGLKSIKIYVKAERELPDRKEMIADGYFTFVSIRDGKSAEHNIMVLP